MNNQQFIQEVDGNVTHILRVEVLHQRESEEVNVILQKIFQQIANKVVVKNVYGMPVGIKWLASSSSSAHYYANVSLFTDIIVKHHAKLLLEDILASLGHILKANDLIFHISKPLSRKVAIMDDD